MPTGAEYVVAEWSRRCGHLVEILEATRVRLGELRVEWRHQLLAGVALPAARVVEDQMAKLLADRNLLSRHYKRRLAPPEEVAALRVACESVCALIDLVKAALLSDVRVVVLDVKSLSGEFSLVISLERWLYLEAVEDQFSRYVGDLKGFLRNYTQDGRLGEAAIAAGLPLY